MNRLSEIEAWDLFLGLVCCLHLSKLTTQSRSCMKSRASIADRQYTSLTNPALALNKIELGQKQKKHPLFKGWYGLRLKVLAQKLEWSVESDSTRKMHLISMFCVIIL